jgi:hypothetical protein
MHDPLPVILYRANEGLPDLDGMLIALEYSLRFDLSDWSVKPINIDLLSHIHHHVMPHRLLASETVDFAGPDAIFLLVVVYLNDINDLTSAVTLYFAARKQGLEIFSGYIDQATSRAQSEKHYVAPRLDELSKPSRGPSESLPVRRRPLRTLSDVQLLGGPSAILEALDVAAIRKRIPSRFQTGNWKLVYLLSTHGCSYQTFYQNIDHQWPLVIAIRTNQDERIGCFLCSELKIMRGYTGSPEAFVFRIREGFEAFGGHTVSGNALWAAGGRNELVIGGGGGAAIWLGESMEAGTSQECATYGSPMLTEKEQFRVVNVEVWVLTNCEY